MTSAHSAGRHWADRHWADRQLVNRHLANRHLANRHLANKHWTDKHLANRHLANRHLTYAMFGWNIYNFCHSAGRHLANRHLADRHLVNRHLANKHWTDRHLANRHLTYTIFGWNIYNFCSFSRQTFGHWLTSLWRQNVVRPNGPWPKDAVPTKGDKLWWRTYNESTGLNKGVNNWHIFKQFWQMLLIIKIKILHFFQKQNFLEMFYSRGNLTSIFS